MGDLFATFNPNTVVFGTQLSVNWLSSYSLVFIIPSTFWIISRKPITFFKTVIKELVKEIDAALSPMITTGTTVFFLSLFFFIISSNTLGLIPYVFTASRHFSFTMALRLPFWLGYTLISFIKQFNINMAHLVPEGTPAPLIPLIVIIESVRLVIRPFTLAVRLAANMVAGHLLLVLLGTQGPLANFPTLSVLIIALTALMTLECAVACIQSYVFTILRAIYLTQNNSKKINPKAFASRV